MYRFSIILYGDEAYYKDAKKAISKQTFDRNQIQIIYEPDVNDAIRQAEGEYTILLKTSDVFEEDALAAADKYFAQPNSCRIMASKLTGLKVKGKKYRRYRAEEIRRILINRSSVAKGKIITTSGVFFDTDIIKDFKFNDKLSEYENEVLFMAKALIQCGEYDQNTGCILHTRDFTKKKELNASKEFFYELEQQGKAIYIQILTLMAILQHSVDEVTEEVLIRALNGVDDDIIVDSDRITLAQRKYFLELKYPEKTIDSSYFNFNTGDAFTVRVLRVKDHEVEVEGFTYIGEFEDLTIYLETSVNERIRMDLQPYPPLDETFVNGYKYYEGKYFGIKFAMPEKGWFRFVIEDRKGNINELVPVFSGFGKLSNEIDCSFYCENDRIITRKGGLFQVQPYSRIRHIIKELKYDIELCRQRELVAAAYRLLRPFFKERKPIWLLEDRPQAAKDNAEHLFRFLNNNPEAKEKYSTYYVLNKDCDDFERMSQYGNVLEYDSLKHKMKFLNADKIIAANANDTAINILGKSRKLYTDLYKFDYVYLRHGVSHNDQSQWLHKLKKNINILCSTTRREYESILSGDYGYDESVVKLTGLARFDNLKDFNEKHITFMPTWRRNLQAPLMPRSSRRQYMTTFKDSQYYKFYNNLINNERLIQVMKDNGYTGSFYVHPVFESQAKDFKGNDVIKAYTELADYQQEFGRSSIMVTDYSSVAFDFAYLKKPIIYSQFDKEEFYSIHSWGKGYFSYDKDGFGDITETIEETVDKLIHYIENGCRMEEKYVNKVEEFFAFTDRNNCRRIYEAITGKDITA